jgi:hypothetical protein
VAFTNLIIHTKVTTFMQKSILIWISLLFINYSMLAQATFSINGPVKAEIGINNTYNLKDFKIDTAAIYKNCEFKEVTWKIVHDGKINDINQLEYKSTNQTEAIKVQWLTISAPLTVKVKVEVVVKDTKSALEYKVPKELNVDLFGICSQLVITGPTEIKRCCTGNVTYKISKYDDCIAFNKDNNFKFLWSVPFGKIVSGDKTNTIVVEPNGATGGNITCIVSRMGADPFYTKAALLNVTLKDPEIKVESSDGINAFQNICPFSQHPYQVKGDLCDLVSVDWGLPNGWNLVAGQGQQTFYAQAGNIGSGGNIVATAIYKGGCTATKNVPVVVLTNVPEGPPAIDQMPIDDDFTNFHCSEWWFCPRSTNNVNAVAEPGTTGLFWEISDPWTFIGSGNTYDEKVNFDRSTRVLSPQFITNCDNKIGGTIKVTAYNCLGISGTSILHFNAEKNGWCKGGCGTSCYPYNMECEELPLDFKCKGPINLVMESGINENIEITQSEQDKYPNLESLMVRPNPASDQFMIYSPKEMSAIQIFDMTGRLILTKSSLKSYEEQIDVSGYQNGLYNIIVSFNNEKQIKRVVVNR